jgi:hypothetical protein
MLQGPGETLAAAVKHYSAIRKHAVLYNSDKLWDRIDYIHSVYKKNGSYLDLQKYFADNILRGFIDIGVPRRSDVTDKVGKCNGAWEVYHSAGPGYGKIVYGMGYALSPSGRLIPDRSSVSSDAFKGWTGAFNSSRPRIPLDDIEHQHQLPGNEYHTDDPSDDCSVYDLTDIDGGDVTVLNQAYDSEGWERTELDDLGGYHDENIQNLESEFGDEFADYVQDVIIDSGWIFFRKHYKPS